ncbi:MAG: hypothetical protein ACPG4T_11320 [Nannocystaceae bacterium]
MEACPDSRVLPLAATEKLLALAVVCWYDPEVPRADAMALLELAMKRVRARSFVDGCVPVWRGPAQFLTAVQERLQTFLPQSDCGPLVFGGLPTAECQTLAGWRTSRRARVRSALAHNPTLDPMAYIYEAGRLGLSPRGERAASML